MKSISFIAFILSIFSNLHVAAQDQIFVEKFVPNNNSNTELVRSKELNTEFSKRLKNNHVLVEKALKEVELLKLNGNTVLTEEEYAPIYTKMHDLKASIAFEDNKEMKKKYKEELEYLKSKYITTKEIAKIVRKKY